MGGCAFASGVILQVSALFTILTVLVVLYIEVLIAAYTGLVDTILYI